MFLGIVTTFAHAGELQFAPDRPGFGDSTTTTGAGHATIEIGFGAALGPTTALSTRGLVGRIGIDDGLEVRVRLPDLQVADGGFRSLPGGLGVKVGGPINERWSSSVVADLVVDPNDGAVGGFLEGNVALVVAEPVSLWAVGGASGAEAVTVFAGGGARLDLDQGGAYVNVGHALGGPTLAGVGAFLLPAAAFQVDAGLDVSFGGGSELTFLPGVGVAFGL